MTLTPARSGLARSGATRSNYPIAQGIILPLYALSGVARSGATRSNWHSAKAFIAVDGVQQDFSEGSIAIANTINATPNTSSFLTRSFVPIEGRDVAITLGSQNNLQREFGGRILSTELAYDEVLTNWYYTAHIIDYTLWLDKLLVSAQFTGQTVLAIATALMSAYAPEYSLSVDADIGAEVIDQISFTDQPLTVSLKQLTTRAGGDWRCNYHKVIEVFFESTSETNPTEVNRVNPLWIVGSLKVTRDLSPMVTRVRSEGGGTSALQDVTIGETILPVVDTVWYPAPSVTVDGKFTVTRGLARSGTQRLGYTGVSAGGLGGLVGPGASPSAPISVAPVAGAGVESGGHSYGVTFVTAAGESIVSPLATIIVGATAAPTTALMATTTTIGAGPNPGNHSYAVTFVTASGETTPGPSFAAATTLTDAPSSAPTPGAPTVGVGLDNGNHDYAMTNVTSIGETTPGPISGQVTTGPMSPPNVALTGFDSSPIGSVTSGAHNWAVTFVNTAGETTAGPVWTHTVAAGDNWVVALNGIPIGPTGTTARNIYRTVAGGSQLKFVETVAGNSTTSTTDSHSDAALGADVPVFNTAAVNVVPLTAIPLGDANTASRNLYRRSAGLGLKLVANIPNNTATTFNDTVPNASLGVAAPSVSTAYLQRIPLINIPVGGAIVTGRNLYGTTAGGSQLKFIASLNATDTTYLVITTDGALGANAPSVNTATANQVSLSGVPIGSAAVTQRKIYRSRVGETQLRLQQTIADNTVTVGVTDSTADASLGANVPTSDTSGLTQPAGLPVLQGASSIPVANVGAMSATGGWAIIGNGQQVIRYTGITGNTISGIPVSGPGAIIATIGFNSTITTAPALTGVTGILYAIKKADPVNLVVVVDDLAAQAALASLIGGTGVQESLLVDGRLGDVEAVEQAEATLALNDDVRLTVTMDTYDLNAQAGRTLPINVGVPFNLNTSFLIQSVAESQVGTTTKPPIHSLVASSVRYTFDEFLQALTRKAA